MVTYLDEVKIMSTKIIDFKISQIPREENKKADALANLASVIEFISDRSIPRKFLPSPSIDNAKTICQAAADPMWIDDIIAYLWDGTLPSDKLQTQQILPHPRNLVQEVFLEAAPEISPTKRSRLCA